MKGLSETISTVMLIALAIIVTIGIYFWAAGQTFNTQPPHTEVVDISVRAIDYATGEYLVTNVDTVSFTTDALQTSAGDPCDFGAEVTVAPGQSDNCTIASAPTGEISFYTENIGPATVIVG